MAKLRILSAKPGVFKRGKFKIAKRNGRKNVAEGFYDSNGVFHPIRASADYSPSRSGEKVPGGRTIGPKKKKARKKNAAKKRPAKAKKKPAVKRAAKAKKKSKKGRR